MDPPNSSRDGFEPDAPRTGGGGSPRSRQAPHPVLWVIAVALVVIATTLVTRPGGMEIASPAFGQAVTSGGARGIFAFSGQLSANTYGVYMVDVDAMTIWTYEFLPGKSCLRLAGARTWR